MAIRTNGTMAVDWENRVDFERLCETRLNRIKGILKESEAGVRGEGLLSSVWS